MAKGREEAVRCCWIQSVYRGVLMPVVDQRAGDTLQTLLPTCRILLQQACAQVHRGRCNLCFSETPYCITQLSKRLVLLGRFVRDKCWMNRTYRS